MNSIEWDEFVKKHPNSHLLQSKQWGEFKAKFGWKPVRMQSGNSGAQILFRKIPLGYSIGYIPKGPIGSWNKELLDQIIEQCQSEKAIVLYLEPDSSEDCFNPRIFFAYDFSKSEISIQPRRTLIISLAGTESDWMERMKQKTRYNIRLAEKKGITVEKTTDIGIFNQLMKVTGDRDQFGVHDEKYYQAVFNEFSAIDSCTLLIAKFDNKPVAGQMTFYKGSRAWYFYGASSDEERNRMPTYLLQWEAIRLAAQKGCVEYDLWGVPDFDESVLENNFMARNDGLWGVYRFKRGFGGKIFRSAGVFQKIFNPSLFKPYQVAYKLRKGSLT